MLPDPALLILTPTSPYARKCLMMALEKGLDLPTSFEPPNAPGSRVRTLNPLGKIPTLLLANDEAVYDSRVIVEVLEMAAPNPALIPTDARERMEALRWQALADGIADAMVAVFMENQRPEDKRHEPAREHQRSKVLAGLGVAEKVVQAGQFLVGNRLTLADLALVAGAGYVGLRGAELLSGHPNLEKWLAWMGERASVARTAPPK